MHLSFSVSRFLYFGVRWWELVSASAAKCHLFGERSATASSSSASAAAASFCELESSPFICSLHQVAAFAQINREQDIWMPPTEKSRMRKSALLGHSLSAAEFLLLGAEMEFFWLIVRARTRANLRFTPTACDIVNSPNYGTAWNPFICVLDFLLVQIKGLTFNIYILMANARNEI